MTLFCKAERHKSREQTYGFQGRERGWDELGDWDWHICSTMYKTDN